MLSYGLVLRVRGANPHERAKGSFLETVAGVLVPGLLGLGYVVFMDQTGLARDRADDDGELAAHLRSCDYVGYH